VVRFLVRAEEDPAQHRQQVPGAQHHAGRAQGAEERPGDLRPFQSANPHERQDLAPETVQSRQAGAGQADEDHPDSQKLQLGRHAAVVGHQPGVVALVEHADEEEESTCRETVVDHLNEAAAQAGFVQGEHAEHADAEVADRAVGDQALDVVLGEGAKGPVDDADDGECADQRHAQAQGGVGGERQGQAQEAVGADLQHDAGQEHAAGGGRLDVGQRQPGVQRHQRHLDGEAGHQGQKDEQLHRLPERDLVGSQG